MTYYCCPAPRLSPFIKHCLQRQHYRLRSLCYIAFPTAIATPSSLARGLHCSYPQPRAQLTSQPTTTSFMSEPSPKRVKMVDGTATPVIGTHNGHFHADEALAVYFLRLLPDYKHATLIRSRDPELLSTCSVVVDVGGVHDDSVRRYDHHQREFNVTFPGRSTKLSSAGLVWMYYGKHIVSNLTGLSVESADCELLYQKLYDDFVEAFDANDNGISVYDPQALRQAGIEKKLSDKGFTLASVVGRYNHAAITPASSLSPSPDKAEKNQDEEDARFLRASAFVGEQFSLELSDKFTSWLPARAVVDQAFKSRHALDPSGRIIVIPHRPEGVPWSDHLYALEDESGCPGQVLYALFAENEQPDSKWRIRAVSLEPGSFENRKGLPDAWRGVRDDDLSRISGIPGCIFVHASGFIGGNATFEGALQMAKKAVET